MNFSKKQIAVLLVSAVVAPWLAKHGFDLTNAQELKLEGWLVAFMVALPGILAHLYDARRSQVALLAPAAPPPSAITGGNAADRTDARCILSGDDREAADAALAAAGIATRTTAPAETRSSAAPPKASGNPRQPRRPRQ